MGKQKKIPIELDKKMMSLDDIPFLNTNNMQYLLPKSVMCIKNENEFEYRYDIEVVCPKLVQIIKDSEYFRFVKDSNLGNITLYMYKNGYYQNVTENEFKGMIRKWIPSLIQKSKDIDEIYKLLLMDDSFYVDNDYLNSDANCINFKNGILNLDTMELSPHTPDKMFTIQIPINYVPIEKCAKGEVFEKYLGELVDDDEIMKECLLEAMGLAMSNIPGYLTKKSILMIGPKDCGKTQIKKLLTCLIGVKYTSSIELSKMNDSRFGTSELYNKRLVGSNDMQYTTVSDMGIFKQLVGGDPISIEFKGRGAFSYIFNGVVWFLANDFPKFSGKKEDAIYQRFMIIPCNHVVEKDKQDPYLVDKMLKEGEYIVSLCIQSLLKLRERKFKFVESEKMKMGLDRYVVVNNTLLEFVEECCDIDDTLLATEKVSVKSFKLNYQIWCRDSGIKPIGLKNKEIEDYLKPRYGTEIKKYDGYYRLSNIKIKDEMMSSYSD